MNKNFLISLLAIAVVQPVGLFCTFFDRFDWLKPCINNDAATGLFAEKDVVIFPQNPDVCSFVMRSKGLSACSSVIFVSWENLKPLVVAGFIPGSPSQWAIDNGVSKRKKLIVYNIPEDVVLGLVAFTADDSCGAGAAAGFGGAGAALDGALSVCVSNAWKIFSAFEHVAIISGNLEEVTSSTSMYYLNADQRFSQVSDAGTPEKVSIYLNDYRRMKDFPAEGF